MLEVFIVYFAGETISEKDKCKECRGKKVVSETKILEVHVDKGMKNEQKIPFRGEGDQLVSCIPFAVNQATYPESKNGDTIILRFGESLNHVDKSI